MDDDREFPSLMDDAEFLVELEKVEDRPLPPAVHARAPQDGPPVPLRREADRYQPRPERAAAESRPHRTMLSDAPHGVPDDVPHDAPDDAPPGAPPAAFVDHALQGGAAGSLVPTFLTILIGLSAGAASSALIFHERVGRLLALWAR